MELAALASGVTARKENELKLADSALDLAETQELNLAYPNSLLFEATIPRDVEEADFRSSEFEELDENPIDNSRSFFNGFL